MPKIQLQLSAHLKDLCLSASASFREAMSSLNKNCKGIVLVINADGRLVSTITDGDIRRALLSGCNLDSAIQEILDFKVAQGRPHVPISAPIGTLPSELLATLHEAGVLQIPILNSDGHVVDLFTIDDLLPDESLPIQAVIMAGGQGSRLLPLTKNTPKPMLPVGGQPVMELMIEQMKLAGVRRVNITTHYLPEQIMKYFGDGEKFGVDISYVAEEKPLGTAGSLSLLEKVQEPLLVVNGDILTKVDFRAMLAFHRENSADLTVGVRQYELQVPYGILKCQNAKVESIEEKPSLKFLVNAGMYLLEPSVLNRIPVDGSRFDMTDLIESLIADGRSVSSFPIVEYWLDIGQIADYEKAQQDARGAYQG